MRSYLLVFDALHLLMVLEQPIEHSVLLLVRFWAQMVLKQEVLQVH